MPAVTYPVTVAVGSLPVVRVALARVSGEEETWLSPGRAGEATRLLAALLRDGTLDPAALPVTVHDRLLAAVFRAEIGDTARCRATCSACGTPFEFALPIDAVTAKQDSEAAAAGAVGEDGRWRFDGLSIRAPTLHDAASGDAQALLAAVCAPEPAPSQRDAVVAFLDRAAPVLTLDLDARCPSCDASQQVAFDLPRFLVGALAVERPFLVREVHLIAARYGWSRAEILAMPRDDRRAFAALIESERRAALQRSGGAA